MAQVFEDRRAAEEAAKRAAEEEERRKREEEERLANMVYEDKPLIPRPYESEEAENTFVEVDNMTVRAGRPLVRPRHVDRGGFGGALPGGRIRR